MLRNLARLAVMLMMAGTALWVTTAPASAQGCVGNTHLGPALRTDMFGALQLEACLWPDGNGNYYLVDTRLISPHDKLIFTLIERHRAFTVHTILNFQAWSTDGRQGTFHGNHITRTGYGDVTWGTHIVADPHYGCLGQWGNFNWTVGKFFPNPDGWHPCA